MLDGHQGQLDDDDDEVEDVPVDGWLDAGWSVSVAEPDVQKQIAGDDEGAFFAGTDVIQTSSRQLQRDLAAPDAIVQASATAETGKTRQPCTAMLASGRRCTLLYSPWWSSSAGHIRACVYWASMFHDVSWNVS